MPMNIKDIATLLALLDEYGPHNIADVIHEWLTDHTKQMNDPDWKREYELLAQEFLRLSNRDWMKEKK